MSARNRNIFGTVSSLNMHHCKITTFREKASRKAETYKNTLTKWLENALIAGIYNYSCMKSNFTENCGLIRDLEQRCEGKNIPA